MELYFERVSISEGLLNKYNTQYNNKYKDIIEDIKNIIKEKYNIKIDIKNNCIIKASDEQSKDNE